MQSLLDAIPRWLNVLVAVAGFVAGAALGNSIDPAMGPGFWIVSVGGFGFGFVALPLLITIVDVCIQLAVALVKIALVLAIVGAVIYGLAQLAGR